MFSLLDKKNSTTGKQLSERTQSKEEVIISGENGLADQIIAIYMLHRAEHFDNPGPDIGQSPGCFRLTTNGILMPAKIFVHGLAIAIVITLELTDQHIQQGHVGTIGARHAPKTAVHKTAQRKYVDQPFQHRLTG
jgi:hypothetical protein